jgi:hypothetical protein
MREAAQQQGGGRQQALMQAGKGQESRRIRYQLHPSIKTSTDKIHLYRNTLFGLFRAVAV